MITQKSKKVKFLKIFRFFDFFIKFLSYGYEKIITNFTIFVALGIFFATFLRGISDAEACAGRSSSRSGKGDGMGSVVVTAIAVLYYAIYEIGHQKRLKILSRADQTKKSDFLIEKDKLNLLNKVSFNIIDLIFHASSTSR